MVADVPAMPVMVGPCVIWTLFSLGSSIGFCANDTAARNTSDRPTSMHVRFITIHLPMRTASRHSGDFPPAAGRLTWPAGGTRASLFTWSGIDPAGEHPRHDAA